MAPPYIIGLPDVLGSTWRHTGGKARGLARLLDSGATVPPAFCVGTAALHTFGPFQRLRRELAAAGGDGRDRAVRRLDALERFRASCETEPLPADLEDALRDALGELARSAAAPPDGDGSHAQVVVRSSAPGEDRAVSPAAGVYTSVDCRALPEDVGRAVRTVWASAFTDQALRYQRHHGHDSPAGDMAVVVQSRVDARLGGVIYSLDPRAADPGRIVVSWVEGHPAGLLAGVEDGTTVAFDKSVVLMERGERAVHRPQCPDSVLRALREALRIERCLNGPLDLEFIVDADDVVHFVQCRELPYEAPWRRSAALTGAAPDEGTLRSPKITAIRLNHEIGNLRLNQAVIRPGAFELFRDEREIPGPLAKDLDEALRPLLDRGDVALRPAYWSALHTGDNMPQSSRLRSMAECVDHLSALWDYVIDNDLDDYSAEVAVLAGNWLPTEASALVAADAGSTQVQVDAVHGCLEGLENLPFQSFLVDLPSNRLRSRRLPDRDFVKDDPHAAGDPLASVPGERPALTAPECVRAARLCRDLARRMGGAVRVELIAVRQDDGARAIVIWQVERLPDDRNHAVYRLALHDDRRPPAHDAMAKGRAVRITSIDELSGLGAPPAEAVLVLDMKAFRSRDRDRQVMIAELAARTRRPLVVRASPLSHFSAVLREYGAVTYAVRDISDDITSGSSVVVVPDG